MIILIEYENGTWLYYIKNAVPYLPCLRSESLLNKFSHFRLMQESENGWSKCKVWIERFIPVQESLFWMFACLKDPLVFSIQVNLCLHVKVYQIRKEWPVFDKLTLQCVTFQNGKTFKVCLTILRHYALNG